MHLLVDAIIYSSLPNKWNNKCKKNMFYKSQNIFGTLLFLPQIIIQFRQKEKYSSRHHNHLSSFFAVHGLQLEWNSCDVSLPSSGAAAQSHLMFLNFYDLSWLLWCVCCKLLRSTLVLDDHHWWSWNNFNKFFVFEIETKAVFKSMSSGFFCIGVPLFQTLSTVLWRQLHALFL